MTRRRTTARQQPSLRRVGAVTALLAALVLPANPAAAEVLVDTRASATTSAAVRIEWSSVPDSIGYLVVLQRLAGDTWVAVPDRQFRVTAARPMLVDGLTNGETYRSCIAAVLSDGYRTGFSDAATPYGLPGAPTVTEVTAVEGGLNVEWTPASPNGRAITAYTITVTPADVEEIVVGGSATSVTIEDLNPEVTYSVTVRATNLRGQGDAGVSTASIQPLTVAYRQQVDTGDRDAGDDAASHGLVRIVSAGPCAAPTSAAPTAPGAGVEDAAPGPTPGEGTTGSADSSADEEASTTDTGQADRQTRPSTAGGPTQPGVTEPEEEEAAAEEESAAAPAGGPSGDPDPAAPESAAPEPITDASTRNSSTLILVVLALLLVGVGVLAVMRRESGPLGEVG